MFKRWSAIALMLILLAGCAKAPTPAAENAPQSDAMGRYTEQVLQLPTVDGQSLTPLGISATPDGLRLYTVQYAGDGDATHAVYRRHALGADGAWTSDEETALSEIAPRGGNMMVASETSDGALMLTLNDYEEKDGNYRLYARLLRRAADGAVSEITGDGLARIGTILGADVLQSGQVCALDMDGGQILLLDERGAVVSELASESREAYPTIAASGSLIAAVAPGAKAIRVYDTSDHSERDYPYDCTAGGTIALTFSADGNLYLADRTGVYRHAPGGTLFEKIVDGASCGLGLPDFYAEHVAVRSEDGRDAVYVCGIDALYRYAFDPDAPAVIGTTLRVFSLRDNDLVRSAVVAFNRAHADVEASYTVAMNGASSAEISDYIKALNTELLAGNGPDVLILDELPVDSYIEKGVLADLSDVIAGSDALLPGLTGSLADEQGAVYAVPTGILLPLALTTSDDPAVFDSIASLADACETASDTPLLWRAAFNHETLAEALLDAYGASLYAGDSAAIGAFLQDARRIDAAISATDALGEGLDILDGFSEAEINEFIKEEPGHVALIGLLAGNARGALIPSVASFYDGSCMVLSYAADTLGARIAGVSGQYVPLGVAGINRASAHQDMAAAFIQTLLSEKVQGQNSHRRSFPVNKQAFEALRAREDDGISMGLMIDSATEVDVVWPAAAHRAAIYEIAASVNTPRGADSTLKALVLPGIVGFLRGETDMDAAAAKVADALSTYLAE